MSLEREALFIVLSSKDKEIAELKVHNEQMVDDCNLYRRKSNDYYCQNDKLQSELSQVKEQLRVSTRNYDDQSLKVNRQAKHIGVLQDENTELKNLFSKDTPIKTTKELLEQIQSFQEEIEKIKESTKLDIEDLQSENAALRKDNSEMAETVISLREEMKKKEEDQKRILIALVDDLKDYTSESGNVLGYDERSAEDFVNIFLTKCNIILSTTKER